jgi:ribosomal protein S20
MQNSSSSSSSSSSNDFFSQRADEFTAQANQLMTLAKTKLANKSAVASELKSLSKAITDGNNTNTQSVFNTLLSHLDQSKLDKKATTALKDLKDALTSGDSKEAKNALYDLQREAKSLANAYSTKTSTSSSNTTASTSKDALRQKLLDSLSSSGVSSGLSSLQSYA